MTDFPFLLVLRVTLSIFLLIFLWREREGLRDIWTNVRQLITQAKLERSLSIIFFLFIFALVWIPQLFSDYALNAWTELLSILVGAILIDRLRQYETNRLREEREREAERLRIEREKEELQRYQKRLILQAKSRLKNNSLDAIDIIREENWLQNDDELALLQGQNLSNADLSDANLLNAKLAKTRFEKATLESTDLRNADLTGAIFKDAKLIGTQLVGAKLLGTDFTGSTLTSRGVGDNERCRFKTKRYKPDEEDIRETSVELNPENPVIFQESNIHGIEPEKEKIGVKSWKEWENIYFIDLSKLILSKVSFEKADLDIVTFEGAELIESNFVNATFNRVYLTGATLDYAVFSRDEDGNTIYATVKNSVLDSVYMKKSILNGVSFTNCTFISADLSGSYCKKSNFSSVDFHNAILTDMQIEEATFDKVLLNGGTVFFDGMSLNEKWYEIYPSDPEEYDLENMKDNFKSNITHAIKTKGVRKFIATIKVHRYTYDDEGSEKKWQIENEEDRYAISIEIKYRTFAETIAEKADFNDFDESYGE